jgi:Putative zinc-finger
MHLDEERIQRVLHGELTPEDAGSARDHLLSCSECRARMTAAESEEGWILDRLRSLDHPQPSVNVAAVMSGRRDGGVRWSRWAAGIVVMLGVAGAAYALPGSPLRRLVDHITAALSEPRAVTPRAPASEERRGIAVAPGDRLAIAFSAEQPNGIVSVSLTDGSEVVLRAVGGAASFTSDVDRLSVDNRGSSARFEVEIPRRAAHVEIHVGGRRVFAKDGMRVTGDARQLSDDRYLVSLYR